MYIPGRLLVGTRVYTPVLDKIAVGRTVHWAEPVDRLAVAVVAAAAAGSVAVVGPSA